MYNRSYYSGSYWFDDKDEVTILIRSDFQFIKEHVNTYKKNLVENSDRVFQYMDYNKYSRHINNIEKDRNKWVRYELTVGYDHYDLYKYQYKAEQRNIYIIIEKYSKKKYFFCD